MRSLLVRPVGRLVTLARRDGSRSRLCLLVLITGVLGSLCLMGDSASVEAQEYSAYEDPDKPVAAFILSQKDNAEEFRSFFGLDDEQMEGVLTAARKENGALARARSAPDHNERVRSIVAETKADLEASLPEDRIPQLAPWMDAKFVQEGREAADSAVAESGFSAARSRGVRCKVFATYYSAHTRNEVALPHRSLKFRERYRKVRIRPVVGGRGARAPVKEVGPWNTRDNYWQSRKKRTKWKDLRRCLPEAQAAYFKNYNRGRDESGRVVTNPAGIDLTLAVAKRMGIKRRMQRDGVVRVYVRYPWMPR